MAAPVRRHVRDDYDGDGKTDISYFNPALGTWTVSPSSNAAAGYVISGFASNIIPVVGDYDGDGKADIAYFNPALGTWTVSPSSNAAAWYFISGFASNIIPTVGDYDGDGKTDISYFSPTPGAWTVSPSSNAAAWYVVSGFATNVIPLVGDYDGDGKADIAYFSPTPGAWTVSPSSNAAAWYSISGFSNGLEFPGFPDGLLLRILPFNITGQWQQASQFPATWSLTQQGNKVSGTVASTAFCGTVTWQVSGSLINANTGAYQLTATNPSSLTDLCGNEVASQQNEDFMLAVNNATGWSFDESIFSFGPVSGESTWTKVGSKDLIQISSSPGVPLNGKIAITVTSGPYPITLTINTERGSGSAVFGQSTGPPYGSGTTINASPQMLYVYGLAVSSTANNISITATSSTDPNQYQKIFLTVISVSLTMRNTGTVSPDNTAQSHFVSAYGSSLGQHVVPGPRGYGAYCAEVMEYDGIVTPLDYHGVIALTRTKIGTLSVNAQGGGLSSGDDTSPPGVMVTAPNAKGEIFDFDAPGPSPPYPINGKDIDVYRQRVNFVETASLDNAAGPVLNQIHTFARSSCKGPSSSPTFGTDVVGDNTSGIGTTPLTWNLK